MWIVVPTYRGSLEAMEFRDDVTIQQIEALIPGNWFGSSKKTREDAISEAKAAGLGYVDHEKMERLRERCKHLQREAGRLAVTFIPAPPETCPEDADP